MKESIYIHNEGYLTDSPIYIEEAKGCYLKDYNGKIYTDLLLGCGTHIIGHNPAHITNAIQHQLNKSILTIAPSKIAVEYSTILKNILPCLNGFVFCSTGTEATIRAMRLARAHTKRTKIAIFSGSWHGGQDYNLFEERISNTKTKKSISWQFKSPGVPNKISDCILYLPYDTNKALELIDEHSDELAMVFIEPVQASTLISNKIFLHNLKAQCENKDILLGFDEILTGFRPGLGGCIEKFDISPDIVTYGKISGGGLPIGIIGYKDFLKKTLLGSRKEKPVFMGGTFSANPMSIASGMSQIEYLKNNNKIIYHSLEEKSCYVEKTINEFCLNNNIKARIVRFSSILKILFTQNLIESYQDKLQHEPPREIHITFFKKLINHGLMVHFNGNLFICDSHKTDDLVKITSIINSELKIFNDGGFFDVNKQQ